jgi:hypothetical protein
MQSYLTKKVIGAMQSYLTKKKVIGVILPDKEGD